MSTPAQKKDTHVVSSVVLDGYSDDEDERNLQVDYSSYRTFTEADSLLTKSPSVSTQLIDFDLAEAESNQQKNRRNSFYGGRDHVFKDLYVSEHYRRIYNKAEYEGRFHFDPDFTWTGKFNLS